MRRRDSSLTSCVNEPLVRAAVLLVVLLLATAMGVALRRRAGRVREVMDGERLSVEDAGPFGERATFVQFSSPACSPCRAVRRVLGAVVAQDPGLAHVDIDATERLDLARRLGILRTPTVLLLDPAGRVVRRICGVLTAEQARAAVQTLEPIRSRS
jgi:thiol-disulfide isomerase/thioredoxin